jgi:hypothetical protein
MNPSGSPARANPEVPCFANLRGGVRDNLPINSPLGGGGAIPVVFPRPRYGARIGHRKGCGMRAVYQGKAVKGVLDGKGGTRGLEDRPCRSGELRLKIHL